jgi:hypothetical protein
MPNPHITNADIVINSFFSAELPPELRLARVSLPEFRFGTRKIYDFSFSCTASATARGPFRFAQEDLE